MMTMPAPIDVVDVVDVIKEVRRIARRNPNQRSTTIKYLTRDENGTVVPLSLVGHALWELDIIDSNFTESYLNKMYISAFPFAKKWPRREMKWLRSVQKYENLGKSWGAAVEAADEDERELDRRQRQFGKLAEYIAEKVGRKTVKIAATATPGRYAVFSSRGKILGYVHMVPEDRWWDHRIMCPTLSGNQDYDLVRRWDGRIHYWA